MVRPLLSDKTRTQLRTLSLRTMPEVGTLKRSGKQTSGNNLGTLGGATVYSDLPAKVIATKLAPGLMQNPAMMGSVQSTNVSVEKRRFLKFPYSYTDTGGVEHIVTIKRGDVYVCQKMIGGTTATLQYRVNDVSMDRSDIISILADCEQVA